MEMMAHTVLILVTVNLCLDFFRGIVLLLCCCLNSSLLISSHLFSSLLLLRLWKSFLKLLDGVRFSFYVVSFEE